jgi:glycosyltransferase involved in cell wall biosynthesis
MKTIGIFTHDFYPSIGGQGNHIYELYKQNIKNKKVKMLIFSPADNELLNHIRIFPETNNSRLKNLELSIKLYFRINLYIKRYNLDIVHLHGGPGGLFLLRKLRIPSIFTSHHTYWQQYTYIKSERWKYVFFLLEKHSYNIADKIICVSKDTRDVLIQNYQISHKKTTVIPNGTSVNPLNNRKVIKHSNEIIYLGRIDKRKGVDYLLESMRLVNEINPDIHLNIIGEGKDRSKLEAFSLKYKVNAEFHGYLEEKKLNYIYNRSVIQVVPSIFEGFGISILDGMRRGIPIVATDVDGIRNIIKNKYSGELVPYGNRKSFAHAIVHLMNDDKKKRMYITNATKELRKYTWSDSYNKLIEVYEKIYI